MTNYIIKTLIQYEFRKDNNIRFVGSKTIDLAEDEWYTCPTCNGTKSYLESADAHRSEGWVPCYICDSDGKIRKISKSVYRVSAKSRKID